MKKQFTQNELETLDFFQLIQVAEYWRVENYEHFTQPELISAIIDKQKLPEPAEVEE